MTELAPAHPLAPAWLQVPADPAALDPVVFTSQYARDDTGCVTVDSVPVTEIAARHGLPYHETPLLETVPLIAKTLTGLSVPFGERARLLDELGQALDVPLALATRHELPQVADDLTRPKRLLGGLVHGIVAVELSRVIFRVGSRGGFDVFGSGFIFIFAHGRPA